MPRVSKRENKNVYQLSREAAGMTMAEAAEKMGFISENRIYKIESGQSVPHPDEIIPMANCYKDPSLCNFYCAEECPIGQVYTPKVEIKNLAQIVLEMLATLNALEAEKTRLIAITVDGEISQDEMPGFLEIQDKLERMSIVIDSLKLWVNKSIANGKFEKTSITKE